MSETQQLDVKTIGEPGSPCDGWAIPGFHSLETAKQAAEQHSFEGPWPEGTVISVRPASLRCWSCHTSWGGKHRRGCDGDVDSFTWDFHCGEAYTIIMRDGRPIEAHRPELKPIT